MSVIKEEPETAQFKPTRRFDSSSSSQPRGFNNKKPTRQRQAADTPFRGVRKRSWGRYVSEIRLPGQKTRIWLGSFGSPEMAARAHDSAAFFLKGNSACLNFPELAELLPKPDSCSRRDIQSAAAKAALFEVTDDRTSLLDTTEPETTSGSEDFWCEFDVDFDLGTSKTSFEAVKEVSLLSPLKFEDSIGEEFGQVVVDDEFLLASCSFQM
ncbi:ethylene-responsive transcription factor ERF039-like [Juglans microcarpa x Juglans regia]|uniref:ethylene-responsive transcription factor ERF039-like n=1 Tax=Juglans microcarpa x Juglans regia TaxID=2249226 RepID=UPI001B7DFFE1|nr:ethylene-responsive transcription factor ERF039-like [Juglans microcarpa x Juglans regia]